MKQIMKYQQNLTRVVEAKLSAMLPQKFALVFDGWSTSDTHYIAIIATFSSSEAKGYSSALLSFYPFHKEESQSAN